MNRTIRNIFRTISIVLLTGIIAFIWHNSMEVADVSGGKSMGIVVTLNKIFFGGRDVVTDHIVRKLAHFTEYTLEGACLAFLVYSFAIIIKKKHFLFAFLGGVLTALCDEGIQLFALGRSAQLSDVCLDSLGVLFGLVLSHIIYTYFYHRSSCKHPLN